MKTTVTWGAARQQATLPTVVQSTTVVSVAAAALATWVAAVAAAGLVV